MKCHLGHAISHHMLLAHLFADLLVDFCQVVINGLSAFCVGQFLGFESVQISLKLFTFTTHRLLHNQATPTNVILVCHNVRAAITVATDEIFLIDQTPKINLN